MLGPSRPEGSCSRQRAYTAPFRERDQIKKHIVEVVGVAEVGARFFDDLRDGRRVELAGLFEHRGGQGAAELHGAGAALFERSIVEEGVGIGVENFVRELRGHGSIDGDGADAAVADAFEHAAEAVDVHGLVHARPSSLLRPGDGRGS